MVVLCYFGQKDYFIISAGVWVQQMKVGKGASQSCWGRIALEGHYKGVLENNELLYSVMWYVMGYGLRLWNTGACIVSVDCRSSFHYLGGVLVCSPIVDRYKG